VRVVLVGSMSLKRRLTLGVVAGAIAVAPFAAGASADAATPFSVSVLHCGGGIHIRAYSTLPSATHALHKQLHLQKNVPHSLHKVQLRHGSKVLASVSDSC
jgi:hypothetical protein